MQSSSVCRFVVICLDDFKKNNTLFFSLSFTSGIVVLNQGKLLTYSLLLLN